MQRPRYSKQEARKAKGLLQIRRPRTKKEEQEFGPGQTDYIICPECRCAYFDKSWHHSLAEDFKKIKETKMVEFQLCPACQMIKDEKYEGEIILENVPEDFKEKIKILAKNYGRRAFELDPMDRVISIEEREVRRVSTRRKRGALSRKEFEGLRDLEILTTENQLAKKLAKKINETFGGKLKVFISHSRKEDITRIRVVF